jgi:hypothetical protein
MAIIMPVAPFFGIFDIFYVSLRYYTGTAWAHVLLHGQNSILYYYYYFYYYYYYSPCFCFAVVSRVTVLYLSAFVN